MNIAKIRRVKTKVFDFAIKELDYHYRNVILLCFTFYYYVIIFLYNNTIDKFTSVLKLIIHQY